MVSTFVFDAEGTPCLAFDAEAHLEAPLTAFVAGDLTTPSGSTGPSLVYLDTGGKVVAYHGLLEQVRRVTQLAGRRCFNRVGVGVVVVVVAIYNVALRSGVCDPAPLSCSDP